MEFLINLSNQELGNLIKNLIIKKFPKSTINANQSLKKLNKKFNVENYYVFVDADFFGHKSNYAQLELLKRNTYNFIMVAENSECLIECIRFGFYDYFLMNILNDDFELFSNRINSKTPVIADNKPTTKEHIIIKDHKSIVKLQFADILFIEAYGSYSNLYTNNKFYTISKTIKSIIPNFPETFIRVHRSYAVNLDHVQTFSSEEVIMNNKKRIKISRAKKMALLKAIQKTA